jgi:hypothetical protein
MIYYTGHIVSQAALLSERRRRDLDSCNSRDGDRDRDRDGDKTADISGSGSCLSTSTVSSSLPASASVPVDCAVDAVLVWCECPFLPYSYPSLPSSSPLMNPEGESEVQDKGESEVQRKGESEGRRKGLGTSKGEDRDRVIDRGRSRDVERDIDRYRDRYSDSDSDRGTAAPQLTAPHSSFLAVLSSALREELNADAGVGDGSARCDSDNYSGGGSGSGRGSTATPTASGSGDLEPSIPDPVLVPLWVMSASSLNDGCAVLSQALHASLPTPIPIPIPMGSAAERARDPSSLSLPLSKPSTLSALPLPLPLSTVTSIRVFDRPCPSLPPSLPFGVCIRRVTYDVCGAEVVVSKGRERETVYGTEILNAASDVYGRIGDRDRGKNSDDSAVLGVEESNVVWLNPCTSTLSSFFPISISPQIERERNSSSGRGRDGDTLSIILSVLPSTSITTSTTTCAKEGEQEPIPGQTLDREILSAAVHWPSPVQPHTNATAATTATARPAFNGDGDASTASVTADCSEDEDEDGDGDGDDVGGMTTAASVSLGEKIGTCSLSTSSSFPCAVPPSPSHSTLWEICIVQREEPEPDLELEWTLNLYTDMDPLDGETVNKEREKEREKNREKVEEGASEEDCTMRERERMRMRMRVLYSLPFDPHTASASASGPSACMLTLHVGGGEGGPGLFGVTMSLLQQSNISNNNSTVHTDGGVGAGSARCEGEGEGDRGRLFLCGSLRVEDTEESDGEGKWRKGGNNRSKGGALFLCVRLALKGMMYLAIAYELAAGFALLAGMRRVENTMRIDGGMERGVERGLDGTPGVRDRTKDCLPFPLPILSPLSSFLLSSRVSTHTASNSGCKGDSKTETEAESAGKGKGPCDILDLVRSVTVSSSSSSTRSLLPLDPIEKEGGGKRETGSEVGAGTGRALSVPAGGGTGGGTVGGVCVPLSNESPRRWALIPMPMLAAAVNTLTRLDEGVKERMRVMGEVVKERMRAALAVLFRAVEGFKLGL